MYIGTYVHICMHIRVYACLLNIRMYILSYIDVCLEMATPITVLQTVLLLLPLCCCGLSMVNPVCHCMMSLTQKVCSFLACPCICLYLYSHTVTAVCVNNVLLPTQPLSTARGLHLTPDNIEYWATFLDSSASIQDRVIHFGSGAANEKLLEVPLGQIDPHATIVITVGLDNSHPNTPSTDTDPVIGISDGTNSNVMYIVDMDNYGSFPPCYPTSGTHDNTRVSSGTTVPATLKLTFTPFYKYGSCETAQEGGYINTGRFNTQLDITKPLYLHVDRHSASEEYYFHYFLVEIY